MKKFRIFLLLCVLALTIGTMAVACRKNPDNPTPGEQVKLTLVANDGSEATIEEIEKNQSYTLPTPTRSGYAFSGWYLKEDFSGDAVTEVKPDADLSVYAKWDKLYTLTLDPNGGTLSTTKLELKAGEKLADRLASLTPTKENYRFGMWLLAGEELGADAVMGSADMTLVARYQTKYYVHVFLQNETLDGYAETPEVKENYAYVGEEFTASEEISGYTVTDTADSVSKLVIADEPTGNIDPEFSYEIVEMLRGINRCGTTIVMVTHEHEMVKYFGGRTINIEDGVVVFDDYIGGANESK